VWCGDLLARGQRATRRARLLADRAGRRVRPGFRLAFFGLRPVSLPTISVTRLLSRLTVPSLRLPRELLAMIRPFQSLVWGEFPVS
jgi:hypothetical protein